METVNELSGKVVDAAFTVHTRLGPGLLESVYETILEHELTKRCLQVERQPIVNHRVEIRREHCPGS